MVFMRVHNLCDLPACVFGGLQAFGAVQRVYGQGLAGFAASDQVIEITVRVGGPDLFDEHGHGLYVLVKNTVLQRYAIVSSISHTAFLSYGLYRCTRVAL
jgi:hypothetical protein